MKILMVNGPNINMLGIREPEIYGHESYDDLCALVSAHAQEKGVELDCFQSNHEGAIVDTIQSARGVYDGIIINPAAHTHYSYAIHDAIKAISTPTVEVHLSDISAREEYRRHSVIAPACVGQIFGHGFQGYLMAMDRLVEGCS